MVGASLPAMASAQPTGVISNLKWSRPFGRPGSNLWATYQSSGNATVTFSIYDAGGRRVRDLGDNIAVGPGQGAVDWEGYGDDARPVPDGVYRLVLDSVDSSGARSSVAVPMTIDTRPPTIRFLTHRLGRSSTVVVALIDRGSGVGYASIIIRGHVVARVRHGATRIRYRPPGGWSPGKDWVVVYASDRVGNSTYRSRPYQVR